MLRPCTVLRLHSDHPPRSPEELLSQQSSSQRVCRVRARLAEWTPEAPLWRTIACDAGNSLHQQCCSTVPRHSHPAPRSEPCGHQQTDLDDSHAHIVILPVLTGSPSFLSSAKESLPLPMSTRLFKRRRTSSISANAQLPFGEDENAIVVTGGAPAGVEDSPSSRHASSITVPTRAAAGNPRMRTLSTASNAAFSSSYNLPSRSFVHHASHGVQGVSNSLFLLQPQNLAL